MKAALVYHFAKFVDWPDEAQRRAGPIAVGVLGDPALAATLSEALRSRTVRGRGFQVHPFASLENLALCHILFVAFDDKAEARRALHVTAGSPTLTIGEVRGFSDWGGIIELFVENNKLRFEINAAMAQSGGLRLSSRLLRLARSVKGN